MNTHTKGLLLTAVGILIVSPDSLLIRLIGMDVFSTSAWRGAMQAIGLTLILLFVYRERTPAAFRAIGWSGVLIAVVFAATSFAFLAAIKHTSVANVLVILASTPFHAAIMSRVFLGERIALRTKIAILFGMFGVAIIVWDGLGGVGSFGDAMALLAAIMLAAKFTIVRSRRQINMIPAVALSGMLYSMIAIIIGGAPLMPNDQQLIWILLMGFAVITPATALMTLGPRYITAPEVSLIVLLETVLGPIWVWLVINEVPSQWALVGGSVVVLTLVVHSVVSFRVHARAKFASTQTTPGGAGATRQLKRWRC